jgi:hypothetical protein
MANRESSTSWREFSLGLNRDGLRGVIFAVDDDHPRPERSLSKAALAYGLPAAADALFYEMRSDYPPLKGGDRCAGAPMSPLRRGGARGECSFLIQLGDLYSTAESPAQALQSDEHSTEKRHG